MTKKQFEEYLNRYNEIVIITFRGWKITETNELGYLYLYHNHCIRTNKHKHQLVYNTINETKCYECGIRIPERVRVAMVLLT